MAFEDRERNLYGRIAWGLTSERSLAARLLDEYMNSTDARVAQYAREVYRDMVGKNPVTEAEPDAEGLEPTARTPRLSPDVRHGEDNR
jgi:hypothetical protein